MKRLFMGLLASLSISVVAHAQQILDKDLAAIVCPAIEPEYTKIYGLFSIGVDKVVTRELLFRDSPYDPVVNYPLAVSLDVIYSEGVDQLSLQEWDHITQLSCLHLFGTGFYFLAPNERKPLVDYSPRWVQDSQD